MSTNAHTDNQTMAAHKFGKSPQRIVYSVNNILIQTNKCISIRV